MNRFFKMLGLAVILSALMIFLGSQLVRVLRDAAAPPPLPYGLSIQDTPASVEHTFGHSRVEHAPQTDWALGLPDESGPADTSTTDRNSNRRQL